jgi:internalin A
MMAEMAKQKLSESAREKIEDARRGKATRLLLNGEGLDEFPAEILKLRSLEEIYLTQNRLRKIPNAIRHLPYLRRLSLVDNPIESVPDIPGLILDAETYLRLRHSVSPENITGLSVREDWPECIGELQNLELLTVTGHTWRELPESLFRLASLVALILESAEGQIRVIPSDILRLENLKHVRVGGHPIETPPLEVVKQGIEAIKGYWRQRQDEGVDYLCEAKLLILGEGGAGKTSLANKIRNDAYELKREEGSTEGIEVAPWSFPTVLHVKQQALRRDFRVNIWDFGGQEIYHSTHQFFLTRRSLYVIVADDRKEDTDFNYWLDVIDILSGGSPVLVIQNEKQDRRREIDFSPLRARFPNLREPYRVNLATNRGLAEAVRAIRHEMERLPHVGAELPATWKRVREALERDPRDYISQDEYFEICQQNAFKERDYKLQLSAYLHDLGICLHFQDDPVLQHMVILKPKWGTDAVYRALDDKVLFSNHGRFGRADIDRIWPDKRHELLRLMMKFQLCYQISDTETYIAPQLLPVNQPSYDWPVTANLVVRYEYDFMPKGLVTRLIVALHHRIADQNLVWRTGAIFQRDQTRAEVIEDYTRRRITVRIHGPEASGLFAIVDDQLDRIHATFPKLKFEKHVPCNCPKCVDDPYLFPLSELKDFAKEGDDIQCRKSRKLVDPGEILRDLFPRTVFRRTVFVSYKQSEESIRLVDQIENTLRDHKIDLLRDVNEVGYRDSFTKFMERLGGGDAIVVVLSNGYFESANCMFELTAIAERGDLRVRIHPIVLKDARIFQAEDRARVRGYWDQRLSDLKEHGDLQDRARFERYRNDVGRLMQTVTDMNMLKAGDSFKPIVEQLEKDIAG